MRVLGIDPGLTRCGMGVVEGDVGRPLRLVDVNVLRTSADLPVAAAAGAPSSAASTPGSTSTSPTPSPSSGSSPAPTSSTVMGTAQASGIAMVAAARRGLPSPCTRPSEVKAAVSGSGRADKAQVGAMVTRILRLDAPPEARRRRRRARPGHQPHLARRRPGPHRRGARRGRRRSRSTPMIAFVRGQVAAVTLTSAVLEVGGVGPRAACARPAPSPRCAPATRPRCRPAWSCARTR